MQTIEWQGSPHYTPNVRHDLATLDQPPLLVLHTMDGTMEGTLAYFQDPSSEVSSHYGVAKDGRIDQYVKEEDGAWTNGRVNQPTSTQILERGGNPNTYTITIEFEGKDQGGTLSEPQYQAGLCLIESIVKRWNIPLNREYIIGHYEIDSVNKPNCPGVFFPWYRLMDDLNARRETVSIRLAGVPIAMGYLDHGTSYAPIRKIGEALGYSVKWNEIERIVDLTQNK